MEITTARILDKRRMLKKTNSYRLAIRVTCNRRSFLFQLDLDLTRRRFQKPGKTQDFQRTIPPYGKNLSVKNNGPGK